MSFKNWRFTVFLVGLLASAPTPMPRAFAATLTVTDFGDTGAPGQLRTLISAAAPGDTIVIPPGTITLTGAAGDDLNASGDLDIHNDLSIQGAGSDSTIIDGGGIDRVFDIFEPASVNISKVTIRNGNPGSLVFNGGGIRDTGRLTLFEVALSGNDASQGGGIFATGTLVLTDVILSGNTASAGGGIFQSGGSLTLTNATLSRNIGIQYGGGIFTSQFPNSSMTLTNVILSGNRAEAQSGGGIFNGGFATLTNVTLSGNTAALNGGGISSIGHMTLTNVTISGNAAQGGGGIGTSGAQIKNTIVASSLSGGNCAGTGIVSLGHNLDSGSTCGFNNLGDLNNTDPKLGPLQNNGGFTATHALLLGSPAIDHAGSPDCPPPFTDQRGVTRPQGPACDIGAYEFVPVSVARIPTLSAWGLLGLAGLLWGLMAVALRRRLASRV